MAKSNKNQKIFILAFLAFVGIFVAISVDMASKTTAPWNKPKQLKRAIQDDISIKDSLLIDSLLQNESKSVE